MTKTKDVTGFYSDGNKMINGKVTIRYTDGESLSLTFNNEHLILVGYKDIRDLIDSEA